MIGVSTRDLIALGIPRLSAGRLVVVMLSNPCFSARNQIVKTLDNLVNKASFLGFGRHYALTLNEVFVGRH